MSHIIVLAESDELVHVIEVEDERDMVTLCGKQARNIMVTPAFLRSRDHCPVCIPPEADRG